MGKTYNHCSHPRTYFLAAPVFVFAYLNIAMMAGKYYFIPEDIIFQVFPGWEAHFIEFTGGKPSSLHAAILAKYFVYHVLFACGVLLSVATLFFDVRRSCYYYFKSSVSVKLRMLRFAAMASLTIICTIYLVYFFTFWGERIMSSAFISKAELNLVMLMYVIGWCIYFWVSQSMLFFMKVKLK